MNLKNLLKDPKPLICPKCRKGILNTGVCFKCDSFFKVIRGKYHKIILMLTYLLLWSCFLWSALEIYNEWPETGNLRLPAGLLLIGISFLTAIQNKQPMIANEISEKEYFLINPPRQHLLLAVVLFSIPIIIMIVLLVCQHLDFFRPQRPPYELVGIIAAASIPVGIYRLRFYFNPLKHLKKQSETMSKFMPVESFEKNTYVVVALTPIYILAGLYLILTSIS